MVQLSLVLLQTTNVSSRITRSINHSLRLAASGWEVSSEMKSNVKFPDNPPDLYCGEERRRKARIYSSFPALVRGMNARGEMFDTNATLENLSVDGAYVRMAEPVDKGAKLFFVVQIFQNEARAPANVAAKGIVLRVEPGPGSTSGFAIEILRHRFL